jgi:two-component system sensor histidine kinase HydH
VVDNKSGFMKLAHDAPGVSGLRGTVVSAQIASNTRNQAMTITAILDNMLPDGWLPRNQAGKGVRSHHLWVAIGLMVLCSLIYYADQAYLLGISQLNHSFFITVHDLHRTLFFIPIIYASSFFRVRGTLISSLAFLCVILPRALLISPYPDPLLRPLIFVIVAVFIGILIATQLNRIEREIKAAADLKAAYQELSQVHKQLEESQCQLIQAEKLTLLGEMAASFVHEAKNPIAAALVLTKMMSKSISRDTFSTEAALEYLSKIESSLARGSNLIQNVLDFSRKSAPTFELCNTNDVIDRTLELTAHLAKGQNIRIAREISSSIPEVKADSDQLQQVYLNLILNAIQAMPDGGNLNIRTYTDGSCWIKTEVQDTGYGISPQNMNNLFTPFFTTKEKGKGVGLGLAVCNDIIHRHQGKIEVQSKEGDGTSFIVYLPLCLDSGKEEIEGVKNKEESARVLRGV